jgi:hypothetical protein
VLRSPLALTSHREDVVVEFDGHLLLVDARQVEREDELVVGLPHVDRGEPSRGLPVARSDPAGDLTHPAAHLVLKGGELTKWFPTYECHIAILLSELLCSAMIKPES